FFFVSPPTPAVYTLSLHDALPIWRSGVGRCRLASSWRSPSCTASSPHLPFSQQRSAHGGKQAARTFSAPVGCSEQYADSSPCGSDRKSTRLNSSHDQISYAVFCLK